MSGGKILIDTNIVILAINGNTTILKFIERKHLFISIITEIELLSVDFEYAAHEKLMRDFITNCFVISIDGKVKEEAARIRKRWKIKLPDAIISASALVNNLDFYSADRGFNRVEETSFKVLFYP